ncbi:site-specific integrase [uncultured Ruegeria sp.]|uniref:tyrosine-type recombinase/integrase n=1 Tax=uncultured Ruegeria sp. TaxID=259304 RepID=UPI00261013FC|nr:site-specific integrase [uncultured Ruegeria sp.]
MPKLTVKKVSSLQEPGMYGDGEGLYLRVGPTGAKSWILRTVVHGRRRELGMGSANLVSLLEAREQARELRKIAREGGDPDTVRKRGAMTFEQAARWVHKGLLPTWSNEKHAKKWIASLENDVFPVFGERPIEAVGSADILNALSPIWAEKHDTAKRIKQRIASVFDWAKGAGHYPHENPVNGVAKALPTIKQRPEHMASLPWRKLPDFMRDLSERDGVSARCLEYIILTAVRSGEARGARWGEIQDGIWTIPSERTKRRLPHRVPLCAEALTVLEAVKGLDRDLVFPSVQRGKDGRSKPMSDTVFKALMIRMKREGLTTHGFRSTFRDWCSESSKVDRAVAEAALHHTYGDQVERAYARSDLFDRRRAVMDAWGAYATGKAGEVVRMVRV